MAKNYKYIVIAIVIAVAAWYVLSGNEPGGQAGFNTIKNGINSVIGKQQSISNQLGDIGSEIDGGSSTAGNIRGSNNAARDAIKDSQRENASNRELVEDSRIRLDRCQQIIGRMEERAGQGNNKTEAGK